MTALTVVLGAFVFLAGAIASREAARARARRERWPRWYAPLHDPPANVTRARNSARPYDQDRP
jgi:hypothetical protein